MEIWKDIEGYEGKYQVSSIGRVRSYCWNAVRVLKESSTHLNYKRVLLCKNGVRKSMQIHRLVAAAFIPNENQLPVVNHIDCNPANNSVENLEWCSYRYNQVYAQESGSAESRTGEKNVNAKLTNKDVMEILQEPRTRSLRAIAREKGVSSTTINRIVKRSTWKYINQ